MRIEYGRVSWKRTNMDKCRLYYEHSDPTNVLPCQALARHVEVAHRQPS